MENIISMLLSSTSQGFLWGIMAIGIYLMYRILDIADLTAEGTFPLGAAVVAKLIVSGVNPLLATFCAMLVGTIAGLISGILHTKLKIPALLTGILTMTGLYSINLRIMGQSNLPLIRNQNGKVTVTLVSQMKELLSKIGMNNEHSVLLIGLITCILIIICLYAFFNTEIGLGIRATGDNDQMSEANSIHIDGMKILTYMISNGLIALSGALLAQANGFSDIGMGVGTIVIGLASIIIAEVFFKNLKFTTRLITIIFGAIVYRFIIAFVLDISWFDANDLKLFSALLLTIALASPTLLKMNRGRRKNGKKYHIKNKRTA